MKKFLVSLVVVLALTVAPLAAAGSTVLSGYGTTGSKAVVEVKGTTATKPVAAGAAGQLPFTGADLMVFVAAGVALTGVGLGMRRLARDKD